MAISDSDLMVSEDISLSAAMQQMDKVRHKLLITTDSQNKVVGLITIGDIQRAIIAGNSLNISVKQFVRDDLLIARTTDDLSIIKEQMIRLRIEYMPVVNEENHLERIIYWETIIDSEAKHKKHSLNLPVVIMAGGVGSRLRPLTHILPKPLLPFGEKTILENIIQKFTEYDCNQFWLSVNYKADLIQFYLDQIPNKEY